MGETRISAVTIGHTEHVVVVFVGACFLQSRGQFAPQPFYCVFFHFAV